VVGRLQVNRLVIIECQVWGGFTNATGTGVRGSLTGGVVQMSTQETTDYSTQQTTAQASSELDITQHTSRPGLFTMDAVITRGENALEHIRLHGRDARGMLVSGSSSGQSGIYVSENIATGFAGTEGVRESVTGETMQESTQEVTGSSTLTTRTASELDNTQLTTQLIPDTVVISTGMEGINYIRGPGMERKGTLVAGIADATGAGGVRECVTGEVVWQSKSTEETQKTTRRTTQIQSELDATASSNTATYAESTSHHGAAVFDAIVISGGEDVRESMTGQVGSIYILSSNYSFLTTADHSNVG
jgi:hypothetical protein